MAPPPPVASEQAAADGRGREQGDHQPGGQAHPAAQDAAHPGGGLVLLDDLDLAVGLALDDRGVVGVDEPGLGVEGVDRVVVAQGVRNVAVDARVGEEGVDGHEVVLSVGPVNSVSRLSSRSGRRHRGVAVRVGPGGSNTFGAPVPVVDARPGPPRSWPGSSGAYSLPASADAPRRLDPPAGTGRLQGSPPVRSRLGAVGTLRQAGPDGDPPRHGGGAGPAGALKIAPSVLSADFGELAEAVGEVAPAPTGCTSTSWTAISSPTSPSGHRWSSLRRHSRLYFDCHLMMTDPGDYLEAFAEAGADGCTVHVEIGDTDELVDQMRATRVCGSGWPPTPTPRSRRSSRTWTGGPGAVHDGVPGVRRPALHRRGHGQGRRGPAGRSTSAAWRCDLEVDGGIDAAHAAAWPRRPGPTSSSPARRSSADDPRPGRPSSASAAAAGA